MDRAYGAVGDGTTDDRSAFQAAFQAAVDAGGGTVHFPPGRSYLMSDMIGAQDYTTFTDNVTIEGYGATIVSAIPYGTTRQAIRLLGNNVSVRGVTINYTTSYSTADPAYANVVADGDAIRIGGGFDDHAGHPNDKTGVLVQDVRILGAWNGGIVPQNASAIRIINCYVANTIGTGIYPQDCRQDILILGNTVHDTGDDAIFCENGSGSSYACQGVRIIGNHLFHCNTRAIGVGGANNWVIQGNTIDGTWISAIKPEWVPAISDAGTHHGIIANNVIRNPGTFFGVGKKNAAAASNSAGIFFASDATRHLHNIQITGNVITDGHSDGILAGFMDASSVTNNVIKNMPGLGISVGSTLTLGGDDRDTFTDFRVQGNTISEVANLGIVVYRASRGIVSGNMISGYGTPGGVSDYPILLYHCTNVFETGNAILNTNGAELLNPTPSTVTECVFGVGDYIYDGAGTAPKGSASRMTLSAAGGPELFYGSAPPSDGYHNVGDWMLNTVAGDGKPFFWACVVAGTPGTWVVGKVKDAASFDYGDADATFTAGGGATSLQFLTTLTADRTLTLADNVGAVWDGLIVHVWRQAGAFNLIVKSNPTANTTLATMAANTGAVFQKRGAPWYRIA